MILLASENRNSDSHNTFDECLDKYGLKIIEISQGNIKPDNVYFGNNLGVISLSQLVKVWVDNGLFNTRVYNYIF